MNTRDPFNLRRTTPLNILQNSAHIASQAATNLQQSLQRRLDRRVIQSFTSQSTAAGGMASSSASNWNASTRARAQTMGAATVSSKISRALSGEEDRGSELPMYKDKPYGSSGSKRHVPFLKNPRNRILLAVGGVLIVLIYFSGILTRSTEAIEVSRPSTQHAPEAAHYPVDKQKSKGSNKKPEDEKKAGSILGLGLPNILKGSKKPSGPKQTDWDARREKVKEAFQISWKAYEDHAWGFDEYHPVSQTGKQMFPDGLGWTIVDALDTMMIMNLTRELSHAREWVSTTLHYDQDHDVNQFEITIRMIGGLLSAHYLSQELGHGGDDSEGSVLKDDDLYLEKAVDLADRVLGAYESKTGIPYASINLGTREGIPSRDDDGASSTSEAATVQLEMKYLAQLTGEKNYWDKAEHVMKVIDDNGVRDGLVPIFIYADKGTFRGNNIRLGSRGDSYYEYLIKQYLQTSRQEPIYKDMWDQAWAGVKKHLITYTKHANLTILAERPDGLDKPLFPKMDHLVCFMPGTIALAATEGLTLEEARQRPGWGKKQEDDIEVARQLMTTCWGMYKSTATGLSPEIAHFKVHSPPIMMDEDHPHPADPFVDTASTAWHMDYEIHGADLHNLQRPETVESLFYMWRILGDETYRNWGWEMFESFMEHTRVKDGGFSSINNVDKIPPPFRDNMESFWLAETLKYMYLLFGPNDVLPLDRIVFNTEAHPLPKFELGKLFSTGWQRLPRDKDGNIVGRSTTSSEGETHA